jgi:hypothetical protein
MILTKKAIGSSLIVLVVFSLLISILLFTILNVTFSDRHEFCKEITLESRVTCEARQEKMELSMRNDGDINAYYEINGIMDSEVQILLPNTLENIKIDKEDSYKVVPHVKGEDGKLYACVSQTVFLSSRGVEKC